MTTREKVDDMAFLVDMTGTAESVNFAPPTVVDEVLQNVRVIVSTIRGEVPLDRSFGIDGNLVDLPINRAKAKLTNEIIQAVRVYEPRAIIKKVGFQGEQTGKLMPILEVDIRETD